MNAHISRVYNMGGAAGLSQQKSAKIAKELGFKELPIFHFNTDVDNDIELDRRIGGTIAPIWNNDIIFLQTPTWNKLRYELRFVRQLRNYYRNIKLVIYIHDIVPMMFNDGEESLQQWLELYNYADLIILPSKNMADYLNQKGLTVPKQMFQEVWDYPTEFEAERPLYKQRMFFTGGPARFPFLKEWKSKTKLCVYARESYSIEGLNVEVRGFQKEYKLLLELSEGGYGLVWSSGEANDYYKMLQPYKVATYLVAGIPIILQKGLVSEEIITKNRLGFVVETLEEADAIVQNTTEAEYNEMVNRIAEFNFLIKSGWFTRKLLTDAVMWLLNDNYKPQ